MSDRPLPEQDQSYGERVARASEREITLNEVAAAQERTAERAKAYVALLVWGTLLGIFILPVWVALVGALVRLFGLTSGLW